MSEDVDDRAPVSRRAVLAAVVIRPPKPARPDAVVYQATAWLAADAEIRRLMLQWGRLETRASRAMDWFRMTPEAQSATSFGSEMARIDEQLLRLFEQRSEGLSALESLKAHDATGVAYKLAVASRILTEEHNPAAEIVTSALRDMRGLGCSLL